jgi:hypothetical protein
VDPGGAEEQDLQPARRSGLSDADRESIRILVAAAPLSPAESQRVLREIFDAMHEELLERDRRVHGEASVS